MAFNTLFCILFVYLKGPSLTGLDLPDNGVKNVGLVRTSDNHTSTYIFQELFKFSSYPIQMLAHFLNVGYCWHIRKLFSYIHSPFTDLNFSFSDKIK